MLKRPGFFETLGDLTTDYGEIVVDRVLDTVTNDELLRDLPGIKTLVALARATLSIRDRLFIEKIRLFFESRGLLGSGLSIDLIQKRGFSSA